MVGIAQCFFDVIDYRYRFSTERFIVPITDGSLLTILFARFIKISEKSQRLDRVDHFLS